MINDRMVYKAISRLKQRSERESDLLKLSQTFVDPGILEDLDNQNHQILHGRRGTGKTHAFKALNWRYSQIQNTVVVYIDARMLGSSTQFANQSNLLPQRCLSLFSDIISEVYTCVVESIIENPSGEAEKALEFAEQLASVALAPKYHIRDQEIIEQSHKESSNHSGGGVELSTIPSVNFKIKGETEKASSKNVTTSCKIDEFQKIFFPDIVHSLSKFLESSNKKLYLLIDEWASIPIDIQPYLAEFLKKGVLPCDRITLKVASIEYRSNYRITEGNLLIGFELGADISTTPRLDDYYVFDSNPTYMKDAYRKMLYKHINSEMPSWDYLRRHHSVLDGETFSDALFEATAFGELCRSAEGVVRDLINIFSIAYANVYKPRLDQKRGKISRVLVLEAASQWFERDKQCNIGPTVNQRLRALTNLVLGEWHSRFFLVPPEHENNETILNLLDSRIIHQVRKGIAHPNLPGSKFTAFCLDYGLYSGLLTTASKTTREHSARRKDASIVKSFKNLKDPFHYTLTEKFLIDFIYRGDELS
ncbi:MAG: hypothetical protein GY834_12255 [Bacteroidetes bacterium]|nr:hypothetical protein [Bacteroidota bacterium]